MLQHQQLSVPDSYLDSNGCDLSGFATINLPLPTNRSIVYSHSVCKVICVLLVF